MILVTDYSQYDNMAFLIRTFNKTLVFTDKNIFNNPCDSDISFTFKDAKVYLGEMIVTIVSPYCRVIREYKDSITIGVVESEGGTIQIATIGEATEILKGLGVEIGMLRIGE